MDFVTDLIVEIIGVMLGDVLAWILCPIDRYAYRLPLPPAVPADV